MTSLDALFQQLRSSINVERLVERTQAMVRIRSENPFSKPPSEGMRELEMANFLERSMAELGLDTNRHDVVPDRPNVWGELRGSGDGPTLMLAAHLDTVDSEGYPDAYDPFVKEGRIYGRGSCDMKATFAAYLEVAEILQNSGHALPGNLLLVGVADEEFQMIGSTHFGQMDHPADFCIVGEPTNLNICPAHKG